MGQQPHARLQALAEQPGVTVTGRVPDVRPYIAGAGVYVVPLRIGGGTRLKVLEAMAMGQAMVSTQLGCDGFDFADGREVRLPTSRPHSPRLSWSCCATGQRAAAWAAVRAPTSRRTTAGMPSCRGWRRCTRDRRRPFGAANTSRTRAACRAAGLQPYRTSSAPARPRRARSC